MAVPDLSDLAKELNEIYISLKPSHRANVLVSVDVELETNLGTITISDARILRNRAGVAWFSLPTFSVTKGREYEYFATVELSPSLHRRVSERALSAFETWEKRPGKPCLKRVLGE